ncbi:MAG: hypothetical protein HYY10_02495 [Candidatus Liptonbacteria bacterium]|nr:hypothetical protein [Candidatus Liptonbacteria bacterium]
MNLKPTTIQRKQLAQRWDMLPINLREAMTDERNSEILWKVCTDEHLSEEKTREVARIAAWVMMGFLHPADVANEVKLSIGIHPELAATIANTLNAKLFAPMREELEGTYAPPGTEPHYQEPAAAATFEDIRPPEALEQTLANISKGAPAEPFFKETPVSLDSLNAGPSGSQDQALYTPPASPFDLSSFSPEPPPAPPAPSQSSNFSTKGGSASGGEAQSSPFILHEEPAAPSLPNAGDFSLDITPEEFGPSQPEFENIPQANIEIGGGATAPAETRGRDAEQRGTGTQEPRTVHYGDLRTPLSASTKVEPLGDSQGSTLETLSSPPKASSPGDVLRFSDFGKEPEVPPAPPANAPEADLPPPPRKTPYLAKEQKKPGFFARFFGKKETSASPAPEEISLPLPPPPPPSARFTKASAGRVAKGTFPTAKPLPVIPPFPDIPPSPPPQPSATKPKDNDVIDLSSLK